MSARPPSPLGRWRFHVGAVPVTIDAPPPRVPPPPRASSIVDPRVGDLGPALLALEDGTVFPGSRSGPPQRPAATSSSTPRQTGYQEVCTDPSYAGQVVVMTYPLIGNYGRVADDDQSRPAVAPGARRRQRHGRGRSTTSASSRDAPRRRASRRSPASTRGPSRGTSGRAASLRAIVTEPGVRRPRRGRRSGAGRAALGGPGLRRPGVAVLDHGRRPGRGRRAARSAIVDFGLKSNIVRGDAAARGAGPDPAAHDLDRGRAGARHRRR